MPTNGQTGRLLTVGSADEGPRLRRPPMRSAAFRIACAENWGNSREEKGRLRDARVAISESTVGPVGS